MADLVDSSASVGMTGEMGPRMREDDRRALQPFGRDDKVGRGWGSNIFFIVAINGVG